MTNHWVDIKNADVILIMGSNCAENHPVAWQHIWKAKEVNNATIISVDPRFTRTSAKADIYAPIRSGTDIAFLGGMINYAITNGKYNTQYVTDCTNALYKIDPAFVGARSIANPGNFSGGKNYVISSGIAEKAASLDEAGCSFKLMKDHYAVYTPEMVERICGTPRALFLQICEAYVDGTKADNKAGTMLYAMGWTQHTVGSQNIRAATILQSLLGNMGVAGGGVNALRGWHNVQGATDHAMLYHLIPGYNPSPTTAWPTYANYLTANVPATVNPASGPQSSNWWGTFATQINRERYVTSMLRAWWPTDDAATSYTYLPRRAADYSYLSLMKAIDAGTIKGLFCWGTNPMVMGPDQKLERPAMDKLKWLVVCDLFNTETSDFWKRTDGPAPSSNTEVYLLPGAAFFEKAGSVTNSSRLAQWKDLGCAPPGQAKDELEIVKLLGDQFKSGSNQITDAPIANLAWPVGLLVASGTLAEQVAMEINGYALSNFTSASGGVGYTAGEQINNFFHLDTSGATACGNWLFCGTWQKAQNPRTLNYNQMKNRRAIDDHPQQIGIFRDWGYSWPVNRRIIYNRASVYQQTFSHTHDGSTHTHTQGAPLAPLKQVVYWVGTPLNWDGGCGVGKANDVIDGFGTAGPATLLPFIMREEGVARLFGKGLADGPLPEHWEPKETPLNANPLTSTGPLSSPYISAQDAYGATYADTPEKRALYPIVCTTYRLSEHWHGGGMSRNLPGLAELQPEAFIEISKELAADKGIVDGNNVLVSSARGSITVKACVTKRFKPFVIDGQTVHQVGMPWHWGFMSAIGCVGASANMITPFIGDANTRIPEYKAFLVNIALVVP